MLCCIVKSINFITINSTTKINSSKAIIRTTRASLLHPTHHSYHHTSLFFKRGLSTSTLSSTSTAQSSTATPSSTPTFNNMSSEEMWEKVKAATRTARAKNAIFSIETKSEFIEDNGVQFSVSVSTALAKKPINLPQPTQSLKPAFTTPTEGMKLEGNATATEGVESTTTSSSSSPSPSSSKPEDDTPITTGVRLEDNAIITTTETEGITSTTTTTISSSTPTAAAASATIASAATIEKVAFNPFLPHEPDMFVAEVNNTHNLLLNKYNVVDYHMVLSTKDFQSQIDPLNEVDLAALWTLVHKMNFLGFFNGGPLSGASQPHKHMQLLPPPASDAARPTFEAPIEKLISKVSPPQGEIFRIPELEFKHSCILLEEKKLAEPAPEKYLYSVNQKLLASQGLLGAAPGTKSYNFLLTAKWMLVVPRSGEKYGNIGVNSIGFLGSILVKTEEDLKALKEAGPMAVLKHVTFPYTS